MKTKLGTHDIIKLAYAAWSLLYIIETLGSRSSNDAALAGLKDLAGLVPDQTISTVSSLITDSSILMLIVVIGSGWPLVLLLARNQGWIFFTFVLSCVLSMLDSAWTILFPGENLLFSSSRLIHLSNLVLSFIMVKFAYRLRDEIRRKK